MSTVLLSENVFDLVPDASTVDFALLGYRLFLEGDPVRRTTVPPDKLESRSILLSISS